MATSGKHTGLRRAAIGIASMAVAILLGFGWLGYLGGDPFTILRPAAYRAQASAPVAILLSGDMGFRVGMGPQIARRLARDGVPVVGVNSLTYFRTTRTPAEAAGLIATALARARAINRHARLILIGQSYGADMLHVGLAALSVAQRRAIALVVLVVPGATVEFRASPSEILTFTLAETDALPTARRLNWAPLLCISGAREQASLCPLLHQPNVHALALPGGHPLHHDADAVYRTIRAAIAAAGLLGKH